MDHFCGNCFNKTLNEQQVCTLCGFDNSKNREKAPHALPAGTILNGRYIIGRVLGQGGFGITYTARDHQTGELVAIKEFFPDSMAMRTDRTAVVPFSGERGENFSYGRESFLQEAETMAQFIGNASIVRVYSYFEENGTAYFVMEYVDGMNLQDHLRTQGGRISYEEALKILLPVMDALSSVHEKGIIHRDVSPDNIYISKDGTVKLLDFGAARYSLGNVSRSLDVILKHGFAPKEQYKRRGRQGPYTDVYSLGATLYFAITGTRPDDAIERADEDELPYPSSLNVRITRQQEDILLKAMAVDAEDRYQTMQEFREAIQNESAVSAPTSRRSSKSSAAPLKPNAPAVSHSETSGPPKKHPAKWLIPAICAVFAVSAAVLVAFRFGLNQEKSLSAAPAATQSVPTVVTEAPAPPPTAKPVPVVTVPPTTLPPPPSPADIYADAVDAFGSKDYDGAEELFQSLGDYEESLRYLRLIQMYTSQDKIGAGLYHSCRVQANGTVQSFGNDSNNRLKTDSWNKIVAVDVTGHTLALRSDGTVTATGTNDKGQCKVSGWKNIIDISAGEEVSAGLKSDGTVVIAGGTKYQDKVAKWTDIVDIACTKNAVFGLKSDGTVVTAGENDGMKDCREWTDIVALSGGHKHLLGLKKDGTVVGTGSNGEQQRKVSGWSDIVAISAGYEHSVGLRSDGTVVATGYNYFKQCNLSEWTDIVAVSAGRYHTLGLKSDGTLVYKGSNAHGQCYPDGKK